MCRTMRRLGSAERDPALWASKRRLTAECAMNRCRLFVVLCPVFLITGCCVDFHDVTGTVTLNGVPLKTGHVRLTPVGSDLDMGCANFVDGAFRITKIRDGRYRLVVSGVAI